MVIVRSTLAFLRCDVKRPLKIDLKKTGKKKPRDAGLSLFELESKSAHLDFASLRAFASSITVVATLAGHGK